MNGLSDRTQAILLILSSCAMSIGTVTIITNPTDATYGIIMAIIGAIGLGIKEALGAKPNASKPI